MVEAVARTPHPVEQAVGEGQRRRIADLPKIETASPNVLCRACASAIIAGVRSIPVTCAPSAANAQATMLWPAGDIEDPVARLQVYRGERACHAIRLGVHRQRREWRRPSGADLRNDALVVDGIRSSWLGSLSSGNGIARAAMAG